VLAPCSIERASSKGGAIQFYVQDRKRLELLCRYIMRPALSDKRMQLKPAPP
jgi:hypothetical protein